MKSVSQISWCSKIMLFVASILFITTLFFPIWQIELDAPQYPEGLALKIWANAIGGDVEIINGLNHYIGMKTLHTKDFIEFTLLPYFIGGFALLSIMVIILNKKRVLSFLLIAFILFGILSMVDFYRWNYDYGHNLDPNAAIKVPGMAYQPPLIGYKQLLNFGAYSIPDVGGWMLLGAGVLILGATAFEYQWVQRYIFRKKTNLAKVCALLLLVSCNTNQPEEIKLNYDKCISCKMTISDSRFASAILTEKGKTLKFDDVSCLVRYTKEQKISYKGIFVADYLEPHNKLLNIKNAICIESPKIKSPMRGDIAVFSSNSKNQDYIKAFEAKKLTWIDILNKF